MQNKLQKINLGGFAIIYLLVFAYIIFKTLNVPITHDEVATTVHYSKYSFWEIMMYPDPWPNNHILNTLSSKLCLSIFGQEQWAVRLPNVLSFILFAIGAYRILTHFLSKTSKFFIPAALLLVASPYMLDFFSLCRGYGMSVAFCTFSVSYLISGFKHSKKRHVWISLTFAILASYANFTLLVFWAAISMLVFVFFIIEWRAKKVVVWKPILLLFTIGAGYIALIANPIIKMRGTDQFEYWTSNGFYAETIYPLVQNSKYGSRIFITTDFLSWFAVVLLFLNLGFVFWKWRSNKYGWSTFKSPLVITTLVLALTAAVNILQCWLLHTPNLNGRTALFFYPLFIIMLIGCRELFFVGDKYHLKKGFSVLMTVFFVHHVVHTMKPYSVKEWYYDANTIQVLEYMKSENPGETVSMDVNWLFHPSFLFYSHTGKTPWLKLGIRNKELNVNSSALYFYAFKEDFERLSNQYDVVKKFPNDCWLLKKR